MWIPRTWSDIQALIGQPETDTLDFKRELPPKGKGGEAGKDVAALTLAGGTLLYGVDEDKQTLEATSVPKISLAGAPERLQAMVGSNVDPVPQFEITVIKERPGDTDGVLVVAVPPSSSAPHMVEKRFPVRRGVTTEYLAEAEVGRLYQRRRDLGGAPPPVGVLLDEFVAPPGAWPGATTSTTPGQVLLRLVARPQAGVVTHPDTPWLRQPLNAAALAAQSGIGRRIIPSWESEALTELVAWTPLSTRGWVAGRLPALDRVSETPGFAAVYSYPATLSIFASWPGWVRHPSSGEPVYLSAREPKIAAELMASLGLVGEIFAEIPETGPVLCGAQIAGYSDAVPWFVTHGRHDVVGAPSDPVPPSYADAALTSAYELRTDPEAVGRRLLDPWLAAFYTGPELFGSVLNT